VTRKRAPSVPSRRRSAVRSVVEWPFNVRTLVILRAARDAHRSDCLRDALDCDGCRAYAARIYEAMVALQGDPFKEFGLQNDARELPVSCHAESSP
jgi:hypothetical protein